MRTFSYLIVLIGLVFGTHHILAQQVQDNRWWYDRPYGKVIDGSDFEAFGVAHDKAEVRFQGTFRDKKTVRIGDFYSAGGRASHNVEKLNIERFWVTSNTIGTVKSYNAGINRHGTVDIKEYILQVGARDIDVAGQRTFGIDQEELQKVILTPTSVSNGIETDTQGDGQLSSQWGLLGNFGVENYGTIVTADVSGGTFVNTSTGVVENLNYFGGTYEDKGGHIETLSLAAESVGNIWGSVDTLMFTSKGDGLITLTLTGFVDDEDNLGFRGIDVQEQVNFANGEVVLDMTEVVEGLLGKSAVSSYRRNADWTTDWAMVLRSTYGSEAFTAASIFGNIDFENENASTIAVQWWSELAPQPDTVYIVSAGVWQEGWQTESAPTPEPATLAVFGLGLAGLGLAARRRKV